MDKTVGSAWKRSWIATDWVTDRSTPIVGLMYSRAIISCSKEEMTRNIQNYKLYLAAANDAMGKRVPLKSWHNHQETHGLW